MKKQKSKFGDKATSTQVINVELIDGVKVDGAFPNESDDRQWPKAFSEMSRGDMFILADDNPPHHYYMKVHDYREMPMAVNLNTGKIYSFEMGEPVLKVYSLNLNNYE